MEGEWTVYGGSEFREFESITKQPGFEFTRTLVVGLVVAFRDQRGRESLNMEE